MQTLDGYFKTGNTAEKFLDKSRYTVAITDAETSFSAGGMKYLAN